MTSGGIQWRRFIVDVLIGAAAVAVALAATGATVEILSVLLIAGALVGIGLMLEPNATAQPELARPGPWAMARWDAVIVDAASV